MAKRSRRLTLRYSLHAQRRLAEIWRWNADQYGETYASAFIKFLQDRTRQLETHYANGRAVPDRHSYLYMIIKKRSRGHGYAIIYEISESEVLIFFYFHTAQDWMTQLQAMLPEE
jgi:plasmid stabilization system protein ParE